MAVAADSQIQASEVTTADTQHILEEAKREQVVNIAIIGKVGSGKTSIASAIVGRDTDGSCEGWESGTKQIRSDFEMKVGQVTINIIDTRGTKDVVKDTRDHDKEIVEIAGEIVKTGKGVILICIKMYERVDDSTLATLATLHKKLEITFWKHVIVALTFADRYEEHKWLKSNESLSKKFKEEVEKRKRLLKRYFTAANDEASPSCLIGMEDEDFDKLKIPVIPTSQLDKYETDRMKKVGCGYWFDQLLIKCCQRVQGAGLIQVHEARLKKLPTELVKQELDGQAYEKLRKKQKIALVLGIIYTWYQEYKYFKKVRTMSRFEEKPQTN